MHVCAFAVADHEFRLTPQPLTVFVGENATFDCVGKETTARYQWIAYDKDSNVIDVTNISIPEDHLFSSQTYTHVQVNEIFEVRCVIVEIDQLIYSERTALKVVGRYNLIFLQYLCNSIVILSFHSRTNLDCKYE